MKTISDKIFELLKEKGMSQKEFAQRTGIAESSISDWKKKRTNPVSDKILIICEVLDVDYEEIKDKLPTDEELEIQGVQDMLNDVVTESESGGVIE